MTNPIETAVRDAETVIERMWDSLLHHVKEDAKSEAQALVAQAKSQVADVVRSGTAAVKQDVDTVEQDAAQLAGDAASSEPDVSVTTATGAAAKGQPVGTVAGTSAPTPEQLANADVPGASAASSESGGADTADHETEQDTAPESSSGASGTSTAASDESPSGVPPAA